MTADYPTCTHIFREVFPFEMINKISVSIWETASPELTLPTQSERQLRRVRRFYLVSAGRPISVPPMEDNGGLAAPANTLNPKEEIWPTRSAKSPAPFSPALCWSHYSELLDVTLIDGLQRFLLELGRDLFFVARQHRITIDGDHFYVDLVFYHRGDGTGRSAARSSKWSSEEEDARTTAAAFWRSLPGDCARATAGALA